MTKLKSNLISILNQFSIRPNETGESKTKGRSKHCKTEPIIGNPTTNAALSRAPKCISGAVNPSTNATNKPILKLKLMIT